jgi:hypothetical protein
VDKKLMSKVNTEEESRFLIDILLTKKTELGESAKVHINEAKWIEFHIQSSEEGECWLQLEHISEIVQHCQCIESVYIYMNGTKFDGTIDLCFLPTISGVSIEVSDGIFGDQSNLIKIGGADKIYVAVQECQFSLNSMIEFATYIDQNAKRFKRFTMDSNDITDINDISRIENLSFKQYNGSFYIDNSRLPLSKSMLSINLFSGIERLVLWLYSQNDEDEVQLMQSIEKLSSLERLRTLDVNIHNWQKHSNYINALIGKCPILHDVQIWSQQKLTNDKKAKFLSKMNRKDIIVRIGSLH